MAIILNMNIQELKENIGEELFEKLTEEQKNFMLETAGRIDFGHPVDLSKIFE